MYSLFCSLSAKAPPPEKKRKETLLSAELGKFLERKIRVKFQGGREGKKNILAIYSLRVYNIYAMKFDIRCLFCSCWYFEGI